MLALFLISGVLTSAVGALPLGASNIAVINTTIRENKLEASKISISAALAEVVLSFYALYYNMAVKAFFDSNEWLQIAIAFLLLIVGIFLFFKTQVTPEKKKPRTSKFLTGFVLGFLNPPVLIFWIIVFGILNSSQLMLSMASPVSELIVFFIGVYLGKFITLHLFSTFSVLVERKFSKLSQKINRVTGSLLFFVGVIQLLRFYFI